MPLLQFLKQPRLLAFGKTSFVVFILTSALSVTSLPADVEKGRRKVVHVLGKDIFFSFLFLTSAKSRALYSALICIAVRACARKCVSYTVCRGHFRVIDDTLKLNVFPNLHEKSIEGCWNCI